MSRMTDEEFFALALARGWTAPPAAFAQTTVPIQPVVSTQPATTSPLAVIVKCEPTVTTAAAIPTRTGLPTRRPSAPSRPLAATRPSSLIRPNPTTRPAIPTAPVQSKKPAQPTPPSTLPTVPAQPAVSAQSTIATPASTRSTAPDRPMGPARVARQAATNSHLTAAGLTGRPSRQPTGAGAPPPRELTTPEIAELHFQLAALLDTIDPFEINFVETNPGGRKTKVDVQRLLGLSKEAFQTIREILRTSLKRTPGIDMTQTIKKQASNYLILRAIHYVLPLLPQFEVYKEGDYWPLQCIASKLFRNGANNNQNKQRAKARRRLEDKAKVESGADSGAESGAASVGELAIKSEVNHNGKTSVQPAKLESQQMFNPEALLVPGGPIAHLANRAPVVIEDSGIANMTHDLGNMSIDPVWEQAAPVDEAASEPFILPVELTGATSIQAPALVSPAPIPSTPTCATSQRYAQPNTIPINIAFTATATATSRSMSKATSAVATTVNITPLVAPQTPAQTPSVENAITPGLLQRLWKLKDADLTAAQINHFPAGARASLLALRNLKPGDIPLDADAVLAASPSKNSTSHPPPYQFVPDNHIDGASSGLSEAEDSVTGLATDREDMEVDESDGILAGGGKSGRGRGRGQGGRGRRGSTRGHFGSGPGRTTRSQTQPSAGAGKSDKPKREAQGTAAQRASGSVQATSATAKSKKPQTKTTKK